MKEKNKHILKTIFKITGIMMILLCCGLVFFTTYINLSLKKYDERIYPNTYIDSSDISKLTYPKAKEVLELLSEEVLNRKVELYYNDTKIETSYKELGIKIDIDKTIDNIKKKSMNLTIKEKLVKFLLYKKNNYDYIISLDNEILNQYLTNIKNEYDYNGSTERFEIDDNRNIKYIKGEDAHYLNVEKTIKKISEELKDDISKNKKILMSIDIKKAVNHEMYSTIDTKVSSFSTNFNQYISRATNLRTGLGYIDGVIVEPGETFSFYKYAGPYNKKGYVFYYEFVGNGVCQIATTTYNAALLGGLEIVERYQHANPVPYVDGGLDATVASYSGGWYVDFKFKNTYKYPIYISAYATGGIAHVDFWSNSNAKEGKTYQTESVKIGYLGYNTYLHVYKDEVEIEKRFLATTWYKEKTD